MLFYRILTSLNKIFETYGIWLDIHSSSIFVVYKPNSTATISYILIASVLALQSFVLTPEESVFITNAIFHGDLNNYVPVLAIWVRFLTSWFNGVPIKFVRPFLPISLSNFLKKNLIQILGHSIFYICLTSS